jgi:hypothetical protein
MNLAIDVLRFDNFKIDALRCHFLTVVLKRWTLFLEQLVLENIVLNGFYLKLF